MKSKKLTDYNSLKSISVGSVLKGKSLMSLSMIHMTVQITVSPYLNSGSILLSVFFNLPQLTRDAFIQSS